MGLNRSQTVRDLLLYFVPHPHSTEERAGHGWRAGKAGGRCLPGGKGSTNPRPGSGLKWARLHAGSLGVSGRDCREAVKGSTSRKVARGGSVALRRFGGKLQAGVCCLRFSAAHVGDCRWTGVEFVPFGVDKPH